MKADIKVTLITVSYNSEATIRRTIKSVLGQTYGNIEYLIIDGASSDGTLSAAHEFDELFEAKGYSYIIKSEPDGGIYDAMNKGIKAASGELIGIINADDYYEPIAVSEAVASYMRTGYDYFYGDVRLIKADGSSIIKRSRPDVLVTSRHWNHPSSFVPKETYEKLGLFKNKGIHDDFDFYLRVRAAGMKIVIRNRVLADFNTGGTSNDKSVTKSLRRIRDRFRCYTDNGYSPLYIVECVAIEVAKRIIV